MMKHLEQIADAVVGTIKRALQPHTDRLDALDRHLQVVESQPQVKYLGVHVEGEVYHEANLIS